MNEIDFFNLVAGIFLVGFGSIQKNKNVISVVLYKATPIVIGIILLLQVVSSH